MIVSLKLTPILICLVTVKLILGEYTITKSEDYVVIGSSITLTCNTGSSVTGIQWITPWTSFFIRQGSGTSCAGTPPDKYQYSCSGGTVFNLTINNTDFCYNGTEWKCEPAFGGTQSNVTVIEVHVPLENVSITTESTPVKPGILTQMNCSTNPCYPEAVITWTLDGTNITDGIASFNDTVNCTGVVTRSSLNKIFTTEDNGKSLICSAGNGDFNVSSIVITLDIQESTTTTETPSSTLSTSSSSSVNSNSPTAGSTTASTGSSTTSVNTSAPSQDLTNTFIAVGACAGILVCGITAAVCFCRKSKVCCFRKSVVKKKTSRDDSAVNETARPGSDVSYNSGFADTGPNYDNPPPAVLQTTGLPDTNTSRVTQNFSHNPLTDNQLPVHGSYKSEDNKYVFYSGSRNVDTNDVNGPGNNRFGGSDYYNQSKKDSRPVDRNIQMSRLERSYNTRI